MFFNSLGAEWEYEKETYDLGMLGCYLPDFWLPALDCWVEVKPTYPTADEIRKCECLGELGWAVVIAYGLPLANPLMVYCADSTESGGGETWWEGNTPAQWATSSGVLCINSGNNRSDRTFSGPTWNEAFRGMKLAGECDADTRPVRKAGDAAKSARFEFGETPKIGGRP